MSSLRTILVPYDFSPRSQAAFSEAEQLAQLSGACIHLLHAAHAPMLHLLTPSGPLDLTLPDAVVASALVDAEERLREVADASRHEVEIHVVEGVPTDAICTMASKIGADLIVMGTHGREGLSHLLHGSVAERTLRRAPCAVLVVRPPLAAVGS